jgi:hypothetical protein
MADHKLTTFLTANLLKLVMTGVIRSSILHLDFIMIPVTRKQHGQLKCQACLSFLLIR